MTTRHSELKMMPLIMGPVRVSNAIYPDLEAVTLQYETAKEAIPPLLPGGFQPTDDPLVTIAYSQSQGVDFMAGNGYRLLSIAVSAQYNGQVDHIEGDFVLAMFENAAMPITTGRELQGIPKVYADISPVRTLNNNRLRCEASLWGHLLLGIDIELPMKRQNALVCKAAAKLTSDRPMLGYKFIPSLDGPPDADYPTILRNDYAIGELWLGEAGGIHFGDRGEQDIGIYKSGLDALRSLPVKAVVRTSRSKGSMVIRNDKSGRLR